MVGLYILYYKLGLENSSPEEFAWFYQVKSNPSDFGFFYASKWSNQAIKTIYGVRNNMGKWKNPFFHFDYAANGFFQNPDNRDRPGLSSDQLARVYAINELPVEEFNWKVLGTSKNLVACGLIPKGATFPDPPVVSSRLASSKKKPKKKSDLGASSSGIRKRKAPTTPPRLEPSSPETESPPAPRPAPQEEGNRTLILSLYILFPRLLTHSVVQRWLLEVVCELLRLLSGQWQKPKLPRVCRRQKGRRRSTA
ncbi:hypothetical protein PanWU01x14_134210 [Parasponia andersonii]|uniref:Uncharacterized protein n=1 Tax=Parasponia andersonii TaxID=3476 RepID=A0A2P5CPJ4_PARAD|nr:hypothetical protein PanWU01x14_134210 [Parasponia andersonii]